MFKTLSTLYHTLPIFVWGLFLYIFNLGDMMVTLVLVEGYNALELNPLANHLLQHNPQTFILFKIGLVGFWIVILCNSTAFPKLRKNAIVLGTTLYFLVFLWHLSHFIWLGMAGAL